MQTGLVMWTTKNQRRDIRSSSTDMAQNSAGVSKSMPQALFLSEAEYHGVAAAGQEDLYQQKHPIAIGEKTRIVSNFAKTKQALWDKVNFKWDKMEDCTIPIHYVPTNKTAAHISTKS